MNEKIRTFVRGDIPGVRRGGEAVAVRVISEPGAVYAVIGDGDPWCVDRSSSAYDSAYVVAKAERYTKRWHGYAGWVVSGRDSYTDPLPDKASALEQLDFMVQDYVTVHGEKW